jgi:Tfp pilus assembly protein PilO
MATLRSWIEDNQTLILVLVAQAIALVAYMVQLDGRVATLETRGSPHLEQVDKRLTVLESATTANKQSIDRVVEIMTRELKILPEGTKP